MILPLLLLFQAARGQQLDLPLTVEEIAGVRRVGEPVRFGVPLPKGLLFDTAQLRLLSPSGKPVPAVFRVASRWWDPAAAAAPSIRWVQADFFADVEPRGRAVYRLETSADPAPPPPAVLRLTATPGQIQVDTGALKFAVHQTGAFLEAPGLRNADLLVRSDERVYKASQWPQSQLVVEEESPLRVVLKRTGSHGWNDRKDRALDYVLRITAYAGKPYLYLAYSVINRQGASMADFVRLDGLWLQAQLEGDAPPVLVEQTGAEPRRPGWFDAGGIGVGLRWFWQLYPKAFEVRGKTLRLSLFPETARPQNIYTGVAKTHEMLLSFGGGNLTAQMDHPLYAVAPPKWYTRDTHALGRLVESSPEAIRPEYWPLVRKYDRWLVASRDAVEDKRDRGFDFQGRHFDEYGMLNFGDAMHKLIADDRKPDFGIHWETEYYDFPHALFLHFFRTGDLKSYRMAVEAAAHLADVDISHYEVSQPGCPGAARTGPGLNHWTRYSNGVFVSSQSWAFYKNEGLLDRYLLTGDLWSRDVARMSADWGVCYNGLDLQSNTRSIGHGLFAMLKAHEVFGDKKYLDRAQWIIDNVHAWQDGDVARLHQLNQRVVWDAKFSGGYSDQSWMYGIALEAMAQASQTFGRSEMPAYLRRAADWIFSNPREWDPQRRVFLNAPVHGVMLTPGLAYIAETSGEGKYWDVALENFRRQTEAAQTTDRLKLFAQLFRNSQRFPSYLSVEAKH